MSITGSPPAGAPHRRATRSRHHATRSGGAASCSSRSRVHDHATDRQRAGHRHERRGRDVAGEQRDRAQPAGVVERGQGSGERHPGRDADARVERRRHHRGQPTGLDDRERGPHPTERRHLDDDDVGGLEVAHAQRVLGLADGLVRGDQHVDAVARQRHPQVAQLLHRRARLLGVLEVVGGRGGRAPASASSTDHAPLASTRTLRRGPITSRTAATRARSSSSDWPALGHLDLGRGAPGEPRQHLGDLLGPHRRHRRVDGHRVAQRLGPADPGRLHRRGQPPRRLRRRVLEERPELAPAGRTLEQRHLARGHPTERHPHRDGDHVQGSEQVTDGGQRHAATVCRCSSHAGRVTRTRAARQGRRHPACRARQRRAPVSRTSDERAAEPTRAAGRGCRGGSRPAGCPNIHIGRP